MRCTFEWDPNKARSNLHKHKVSFNRAANIFLDPFAISIVDEEHCDEEERWITIGKDCKETVLVVIHTFQEAAVNEWIIRIILARKTTKNEIKQYEEN